MTSGKIVYMNRARLSLASSGVMPPFYSVSKVSGLTGKTLEFEVMATTMNVAGGSSSSITLYVHVNGAEAGRFILGGSSSETAGYNPVGHSAVNFAFYPGAVPGMVRIYPSESTALSTYSYYPKSASASSLPELDIPEGAEISFAFGSAFSADSVEFTLVKVTLVDADTVLFKLREPLALVTPLAWNYPLVPAMPIREHAGKVLDIVLSIQGRNASPAGILNTTQYQTSNTGLRTNWLQQTYLQNTVHCRRWLTKINSHGIMEAPVHGTTQITIASFQGSSLQSITSTPAPAGVSDSRLHPVIASSTEGAEILVTDFFVRIRE